MEIKMIGHSSVLIKVGQAKIITDPYFGEGGNLAFKRLKSPLDKREDLLDIDAVLVSHNHWDHMDRRYFSMLSNKTKVIVPKGISYIKNLFSIKNAVGMRKYEKMQIGDITITCVPAVHPAICCGYIIEAEGKTIYFTGDTYYSGFMKKLCENYSIDVMLMPVTTFRMPMTMSEKTAVKAVKILNPKRIIPIHLDIQPRLPFLRTKDSVDGFIARLKDTGSNSEISVLEGKDKLVI